MSVYVGMLYILFTYVYPHDSDKSRKPHPSLARLY